MTDKIIPKSFRFSTEDIALVDSVKSTYGIDSDTAAIRFALTTTLRVGGPSPAKEVNGTSKEDMFAVLDPMNVAPGDLCPKHNQTYFSCWKRHV